MSICEWMDKENTIYTYKRILFSFEKEVNSVICDNMDDRWGYILSEISQSY